MPRAGGIFTLVPGYFAVDGTTIEVSQHNPVFEDVAQALTDSLPRDGSAPMTGNLAMGSNKITGLAAGTNPADAVRFDQLPSITPTTATLTAGTNAQGQGPITTDQVTITTAAANPSGATLPTAVAAKRVIIANRGANPVNIYPAAGASIGALAANAPVLLAVNQSVEFFARSATQWEGQISQPLDADLTAVAGLSTTGLVTRTGAGTMATRQITSTGGTVAITNPAGIAGDINLEAQTATIVGLLTTTGATTVGPWDLPAGVKRFTITSNKSSLSGTGHILVQLRVAASFVTTGYESESLRGSSGNVSSTSGMIVSLSLASAYWKGSMTFFLHDPATNLWLATHDGSTSTSGGDMVSGAGSIALAGAVDGVQINSTAGTFDVSSFNVFY